MLKLKPDVYVFNTNAHTALISSGRLLLIDTGTKPDGSLLFPELSKAGYKIDDVESIVITHTHPDHVGGLAETQEKSGAKVAAHKIEAPFISKQEVYQGPPGAGSQRHPGTPVDVLLEDGDKFEGLLVIHTPGHTLGHIALLDTEASILYAGDSLMNSQDGFAPMNNKYNVDPEEHLKSIKKLADYQFDTVVFGHGDPVAKGAADKFRQLIESMGV